MNIFDISGIPLCSRHRDGEVNNALNTNFDSDTAVKHDQSTSLTAEIPYTSTVTTSLKLKKDSNADRFNKVIDQLERKYYSHLSYSKTNDETDSNISCNIDDDHDIAVDDAGQRESLNMHDNEINTGSATDDNGTNIKHSKQSFHYYEGMSGFYANCIRNNCEFS